MAQRIGKCGTCGETNSLGWYSKSVPKNYYGSYDLNVLDAVSVAYCTEECRDAADAAAEMTARPAVARDTTRDLCDRFLATQGKPITPQLAMLRGQILTMLADRDCAALNAWLDSGEDAPHSFYGVR